VCVLLGAGLVAAPHSVKAQEAPAAITPEIKPQVPPSTAPAAAEKSKLSGAYQATGNISTIGRAIPSLNNKLTLSYAPNFGGAFDFRAESSYNADPPGQLIRNINERKFESQFNYSHPINDRLGVTVGILYHRN